VSGDRLKLTAYFGERERVGGGLLADALLDLYERHRVEAGILLRGVEGYGLGHQLRTDRLLSLSEDLPVVSVAVDAPARIEALAAEVEAIRGRGLLTLERARMLGDGIEASPLPEEPGEATKLTVYLGRHERAAGKPAFVALCDLLRRRGFAGATTLLGVDGTVGGRRERGRFFSGNAAVPTMTIAVGRNERVAAVLPEIADLLGQPPVTLELVRICKRDGELLALPHPVRDSDERGRGRWRKLTIYSSESAPAGERPIHLELIRRLRLSGAAGATALRGVHGFHGDHEPGGDRLLRLRRRAPIVTVAVDTPERIAAAFEIVDEITAEAGLVTSETLPATRAEA
jgi:PII-like signaling protein